MKNVIVKLLLALALGLISGEIAGVSKKVTKYYIVDRELVTHEVDPFRYTQENEGYRGVSKYSYRVFNKSNFYLFGILTFSVALVILLIPELKYKNT